MKKYFFFFLSILCIVGLVFVCFIVKLSDTITCNFIRYALILLGILFNFLYYYLRDIEEQDAKQNKHFEEVERLEKQYKKITEIINFLDMSFFEYYSERMKTTNCYLVVNTNEYIIYYDNFINKYHNNNIYFKGSYLITALIQSNLYFSVYRSGSDYEDYQKSRDCNMKFYVLVCLVFIGFRYQDIFPISSYCSSLVCIMNNYINKKEIGTANQIEALAKTLEKMHKNYIN